MAIEVITLTGGLVADAETRFTPSGSAVTEFRIAQSDNKQNPDTKQWETTRALWLTVTIWDENPQYKQNPIQWAQLAGNLTKGQRVAVRGKLFTDEWEKDGQKRSQIKFLAESFYVMPDTRGGQQGQQSGGWNNAQPQGGFQQSQGGFGQAQANVQQGLGGFPQGQQQGFGQSDQAPF